MLKKDPIPHSLMHIYQCLKMPLIGISLQLHGGIHHLNIPSRGIADSGTILYTILTSSNRRYPHRSIRKHALSERDIDAQFQKWFSATPKKNLLQIDMICRLRTNRLVKPTKVKLSDWAGRPMSELLSTSAVMSMPSFKQKTIPAQSMKVT